jgi:hypothetical protein
MYAVMEDHLKTDKGMSLVSHYESTCDALSIYRDLKKHALSSTAVQLSGDILVHHNNALPRKMAWYILWYCVALEGASFEV